MDLLGSSSPASDCESDDCAGETGLLKTWWGIVEDRGRPSSSWTSMDKMALIVPHGSSGPTQCKRVGLRHEAKLKYSIFLFVYFFLFFAMEMDLGYL